MTVLAAQTDMSEAYWLKVMPQEAEAPTHAAWDYPHATAFRMPLHDEIVVCLKAKYWRLRMNARKYCMVVLRRVAVLLCCSIEALIPD